MDPKFIPSAVEATIYKFWEDHGLLKAKVDPQKEPFSIILPPPNANGHLHVGHGLFIYEDALIRYNRLMGKESYWQLGLDHAGIETQFVFEKLLRKQGKSRFDYDRDTLYKMIWDFVMESKGVIKAQIKRLGFALDWSREKFTMDEDIVKIVYATFKHLHDEGLIYRAKKLLNYCTHCGTSFSDLEVNYVERIDPLYYMKYGPFELATVRPETKFGDTGVAVNPKDKRYKQWIGKEITVEGLIGPFTIKVIGDEAVDPKFGTGVVKVTPAHDFNDYEMAQRHNLPLKQVIDFTGRLNEYAGRFAGLKVMEARKQVIQELQEKGLMAKVDETYSHRVATCYKCGRILEPLPREQWFIKTKPLADAAIKLIKSGKIAIYPKRFKTQLIKILENFIDWNISRQIVWGIRIPAYHCKNSPDDTTLHSHESGNPDSIDSRLRGNDKDDKWFISPEKPQKCQICGDCEFVQDTDTFDTWFSSAQWPFATLKSQGEDFYKYFYPTSVMETGHDILRAWVARMIMIGYFETKHVPFKNVLLHGMVRDKKGQKMSKSKGNVLNPLELVDRFGADAFRAALVFGIKEGADVSLSDDKIVGMRNFTNKIWNIGRFLYMSDNIQMQGDTYHSHESGNPDLIDSRLRGNDNKTAAMLQAMKKELTQIKKSYIRDMNGFKFSKGLNSVYEFLWHRFADYYIEQLKQPIRDGNIDTLRQMREVYFENLKMIHPFMPFVSEAAWQVFHGSDQSILTTSL